MGYKPKLNVPATTTLSIYQIVPSIGSGDTVRPDWRYNIDNQRRCSNRNQMVMLELVQIKKLDLIIHRHLTQPKFLFIK